MRRDQEILEQISDQRSKTLNRIEQRLHDFIEVALTSIGKPTKTFVIHIYQLLLRQIQVCRQHSLYLKTMLKISPLMWMTGCGIT
jgi:hypothetical protein